MIKVELNCSVRIKIQYSCILFALILHEIILFEWDKMFHEDFRMCLLLLSVCVLLRIHLFTDLLIPYPCSFCNKRPCGTLSKALAKSRYILVKPLLSFSRKVQSSITCNSCNRLSTQKSVLVREPKIIVSNKFNQAVPY